MELLQIAWGVLPGIFSFEKIGISQLGALRPKAFLARLATRDGLAEPVEITELLNERPHDKKNVMFVTTYHDRSTTNFDLVNLWVKLNRNCQLVE